MTQRALAARLRAAGSVFAEEEADLLAHAADGAELETLVRRRVDGEPLEHVLGWVEFAGLRLGVGPGVFVPRQRTVHLAELAARLAAERRAPTVVELCCGAGAIAAVVCDRVPAATVLAAELDPTAVAWARRNLEPRGARVLQGDLDAPLPHDLRGRVDVLAVNAPYVPSGEIAAMPPEARDHEPRQALDGGDDGLDVHRRVATLAPGWLRPGGHLLVEVGEPQVGTALALFGEVGLAASVERDADAGATVVVGERGA